MSETKKPVSRQRLWQRKQVAAGLCEKCMTKRNQFAQLCDECHAKRLAMARKRYALGKSSSSG